MKGQEHTLMSYLVWAVFFVGLLVLVYGLFNTTIKSAVPSPLPQIVDVARSAVAAHEAGIGEEVCAFVSVSGEVEVSEEFIKERTGFRGDVELRCASSRACREEGGRIVLEGGRGKVCAYVEYGKLVLEWR